MNIKILENLLQETIDRGNLRDRHHQVVQKRIMVNLGLLKSGKVGLRPHDRSGKPEKTSGDAMQQVVPHRVVIEVHVHRRVPNHQPMEQQDTQILLTASLSCTSLKRTKQCDQNDHQRQTSNDEDTCQAPTELRLSGLFDRNNLDPKKPKSNMLTPKNQLADMLTKGSFARDEWDHLIRLLNIMNFSMFACRHFSFKQKAKHVQESLGKHG